MKPTLSIERQATELATVHLISLVDFALTQAPSPIPGSRHPNGFRKVELSRRDGYRLRLHYWLPDESDDGDFHNHCFSFASRVLKGELESVTSNVRRAADGLYQAASCRHEGSRYRHRELYPVQLIQQEKAVFTAGDRYTLDHRSHHSARAVSPDPTITAMLRTAPITRESKVIRPIGSRWDDEFETPLQDAEVIEVLEATRAALEALGEESEPAAPQRTCLCRLRAMNCSPEAHAEQGTHWTAAA